MVEELIDILMTVAPDRVELTLMCPSCITPLYTAGDCVECGLRMPPERYSETMLKAGEWMNAQGYGVKA